MLLRTRLLRAVSGDCGPASKNVLRGIAQACGKAIEFRQNLPHDARRRRARHARHAPRRGLYASEAMKLRRKLWTDVEIWRLIAMHPDMSNVRLARRIGHPVASVTQMATKLGLHKTREYLSTIPAATGMTEAGRVFRFPKGHVPANKGLRRPGYAPGRMRATQFKKGGFPVNRDPDFYVPGALRVNADGYIDMRTSFAKGALGWTALHRILWEDAHGPIPKGFKLRFKDGDKLNVELGNLELISDGDLLRRNSIHRFSPVLRSTINMLGQLKRRIREKQDGRSA